MADNLGMASTLRKFIARAPRYTLRPSDNRLMRYAHEGESGQIFTTRIVDVSQSGVSFIADRENAPFIHERVKLEIPLEDGQQVAWWGKVVRVEEYASHKWYLKKDDFQEERQVLVAVRFEGMPSPHVAKITYTLDKKFQELSKERKREAFKNLTSFWTHYAWEFIFYIGVVLAGAYILWSLSRPSDMYNPERGAPWGQRMWYLDDSK